MLALWTYLVNERGLINLNYDTSISLTIFLDNLHRAPYGKDYCRAEGEEFDIKKCTSELRSIFKSHLESYFDDYSPSDDEDDDATPVPKSLPPQKEVKSASSLGLPSKYVKP